MHAAAYLHIRARDGRATRIVPLSDPSVRVGRGRSCEVRIDEPTIAEVEFLLRRRGDSWHLQPVRESGGLTIDGRPADRPRPLPMGATLRLADRWLTLLPTDDAPDLESGPEPESDPPPAEPPTSPAEALEGRREELARWEARLKQRERWLTDRLHERQWEARWRAAGTSLKNRPKGADPAPRPRPAAPPSRPTPTPTPTPAPPPIARTITPGPSASPRRGVVPPAAEVSHRPFVRPIAPEPPPVVAPPPIARPTARVGRTPVAPPPAPEPPPSVSRAVRLTAEVIPAAHARGRAIGVPETVIEVDDEPIAPPPPAAEVVEAPSAGVEADEAPAADIGPLAVEQPPEAGPSVVEAAAIATLAPPSDPVECRDVEPPANMDEALDAVSSAQGLEPDAGLTVEDEPAAVPIAMPPALLVPVRIEPTPPIAEGNPEIIDGPGAGAGKVPSWFPVPTIALSDLVGFLSRKDREPAGPSPSHPGVDGETSREEGPPTVIEPTGPVVAGPSLLASGPVEAAEVIPAEDEGAAPGRSDLPGPAAPPDEPMVMPRASGDGDWPPARAILGAQPASDRRPDARPKGRARKAKVTLPLPTDRRAPDEWTIPGGAWLCIPLMFAALAAGVLGVRVSWTWARVDKESGRVADRLAAGKRPEGRALDRLLDREAALPMASWKDATADGILARAALLSGPGPSGDPGRLERAGALLHAAGGTSPNHPGLRFARAWRAVQEPGSDHPSSAVGLSRDAWPLAWSARALLAQGKVDDASRAYRSALELACRARPDASAPPIFVPEPPGGRFAMPLEGLVGAIVADMADRPEWSTADWEGLLPDFAVAPLAAARLLRARGDADADRLLARAAALADEPAPEGCSPAIHLAAAAEAMALDGRFEEAERRYDEAVGRLSAAEEAARRPWMFNLAELRGRLDDREGEREALLAAMITDTGDPVTAEAIRARRRRGIDLASAAGDGAAERPGAGDGDENGRTTFGE